MQIVEKLWGARRRVICYAIPKIWPICVTMVLMILVSCDLWDVDGDYLSMIIASIGSRESFYREGFL